MGSSAIPFDKEIYLKSENIVFENPFNLYMTKEEIKDEVELMGNSSGSKINLKKTVFLVFRSLKSTERISALALEALFKIGQDTLYTNPISHYILKIA